ncbi:MAG: hypothetical protein J6Y02_10095 [Pseudobutyrivibrio sp.]|nr:hypothetical protein [Pseudobutyrivibrio sp.]
MENRDQLDSFVDSVEHWCNRLNDMSLFIKMLYEHLMIIFNGIGIEVKILQVMQDRVMIFPPGWDYPPMTVLFKSLWSNSSLTLNIEKCAEHPELIDMVMDAVFSNLESLAMKQYLEGTG